MSTLKTPPTYWDSPAAVLAWAWRNRPTPEGRRQVVCEVIAENIHSSEIGFARELLDLCGAAVFTDEAWPNGLPKKGRTQYRPLYTNASTDSKHDTQEIQSTVFEALWVLAYKGRIQHICDLQSNADGMVYLNIRLHAWAEEYLLVGGDFNDKLVKHWEDDLFPNFPNEEVLDWAAIDKLDARRRANIKQLKKP